LVKLLKLKWPPLVRSTRLLKLIPKTAIKISNRIVERNYIIAKILFMNKANTKKSQKIRTSFWRAARRALARRAARKMKRKINGRRFAPPTKKSEKFQKVKLWSIFMTLLELILSKIPEKSHCPPRKAGRAGKPIGSRAKIIFPQAPF